MAVARVQQQEGEPLVDVLDYRPCPDPAQRAQVLSGLVRERGLAGCDCVCVLHPADYQLSQIDAPEVPATELREALRWRLKEFLTYRAEEAVVDAFEVPPAKGRAGPKMMFAVAAQNRFIHTLVEIIKASGLQLLAIDVAELALRNIAAQVDDQGGGIALVALGESGGLITISQSELLYLARGLEFGEAQLEQNAAGFGDTLVLELQRSLDYYESQLAARPASRVLVAPMRGDREALLARMNEQMGMASFGMDLGQIVELKAEAPAAVQARALFAVGGALRREQQAA